MRIIFHALNPCHFHIGFRVTNFENIFSCFKPMSFPHWFPSNEFWGLKHEKLFYPNNIKSKLYTVCNSLHTCQARTTLMLFNTTFNNISVIMVVSFIDGGPRENHDLSQVTDKLYHIMLYTSPWSRFELTTSVVIDTDCRGSCESNCHTITATAAPDPHWKWSEYSNVLEIKMKMWIHVPQHKDTMYTTLNSNNVCPCYIVYIKLNKKFSVIYTE